jgi:signal transduction histidine kinase
MRQLIQQTNRWVFSVATIFIYTAVLLRAVITFRNEPYFIWMIVILFIWMVLAISEPAITPGIPRYFPIYLAIQTILIFLLLSYSDSSDFFAALLMILSMQTMLRLTVKVGILLMGLVALVMALILIRNYQIEAVALTLVYTAGNVLLGFYSLATRWAQDARFQNHKLAQQLQEANRQLTAFSIQMEQFGAARERARLARDLHDSVTQTVFSMSLTAQSAGLLFDRDPSQVSIQLERLRQLTQSALSEMKLLVTELQPPDAKLYPVHTESGGLESSLRKYVQDRVFLGDLSISWNSEGQGILGPAEEHGVFRIVQEALNNIVKHSQTSQASLRLHLVELSGSRWKTRDRVLI